LKQAGVVWNEKTLDDWLRDPAAFIPGNQMQFQGLRDARPRKDLVAYLKAASEGKTEPAAPGGGMMGSPQRPDLKKLDAENRVAAIRYCADSYFVTTANGENLAFWEFNLRFKTDSSSRGPARGQPVLVPAGMMGDRAQVVFSSPSEISGFIRSECRER
jgi:cytochrome c